MEGLVNYIIVVNIITFILFGIDKYAAKKNKSRISEKTLFLATLLGGLPAAIIAMKVFKHKRRKKSFVGIIVVIFAIQLFAIYWYMTNVV